MQLPPDLVIFDCDGVLVDSEPLTNGLIRDNLAQYGLDLPMPQIMDLFVGGTIAGAKQRACELGATLPDDWVEEIYEQMFEVLGEKVELIPGITDVLDALDKAGIIYAVGSNGPHRKMEVTLNRTMLMPRLMGRIVSREDVPRPKPAPDVYLKAAEITGIAPARAVVVEDSASGAKAGQAAGMVVFGFAAETPVDRLNPHCDAIFDKMTDLPALLGL